MIVSTLLTTVGASKSPLMAGNGGFGEDAALALQATEGALAGAV